MQTNNRRQRLQFSSANTAAIPLRSAVIRALLFTLIWWILTDGAMNSWLVGAPVVLLSTIASIMLLPPFSWSLTGIIRFIPFFLWRSLCAATDVARRALHPRLPIAPGLYYYRWRLPPGLPQIFMTNIVSLLPGTLSTELGHKYLCVHVIDHTGAFSSELSIIEEYVARLFALNLLTDRSKNHETL